jgi:hypothetical protein
MLERAVEILVQWLSNYEMKLDKYFFRLDIMKLHDLRKRRTEHKMISILSNKFW